MKTVIDMRDSLMEAIHLVKTGKLDVEKAKMMAELGQVLVNSAKVEVEQMKIGGTAGTGFIPIPEGKIIAPEPLMLPEGEQQVTPTSEEP